MAEHLRTRVGIAAAVLSLVPMSWVGLGLAGKAGGQVTALPASPATAAAEHEVSPEATPEPEPSAAPVPPAPPGPQATLKSDPQPTRPPAPVPAPQREVDEAPAAPQRPARAASALEGCTRAPGAVRPTRFEVPRMGVNVPTVTVGKDQDGNPGVAKSLWAAAYYNGSPAPNTTRGNVIINIHSNMKGRALGNDLHQNGLRPGDIIRIPGADGRVACYRYREKVRIMVKNYNPRSGVYHNTSGRPQLAIMTCWDRNPRTGIYESRIIFYADRIA